MFNGIPAGAAVMSCVQAAVQSVNSRGTAPFLFDQFNDPDETLLSAHAIGPTNKPGASWTYYTGANNARIRNNRVHCNGLFDAPTGWTCNLGRDNYELSIDYFYVDTNGDGAGLIFRWSNSSNHWRARFRKPGTNLFEIAEITSGSTVVRQSVAVTITGNTLYKIKVRVKDGDVTATLNGGSTLTHSGVQTGRTRAGFILLNYGSGGAEYVDNFKAVAL